ncbi:MAG: hypothetical protein LUI05_05115 [Oscillospiraceae bacterium]|nr:hypothetical protein [Oscillospiraceae bacterium]
MIVSAASISISSEGASSVGILCADGAAASAPPLAALVLSVFSGADNSADSSRASSSSVYSAAPPSKS